MYKPRFGSDRRVKHERQWKELQRQRTQRLLRTSEESGLCLACDLITKGHPFNHHDYEGLRMSASSCRICRLFLDCVTHKIHDNASSEITAMLNKNRLLYRFQSYPALTFDLFTVNDGAQSFIDPAISTMKIMINNALCRSDPIVKHLHSFLQRHPAESCVGGMYETCIELDRNLCTDT